MNIQERSSSSVCDDGEGVSQEAVISSANSRTARSGEGPLCSCSSDLEGSFRSVQAAEDEEDKLSASLCPRAAKPAGVLARVEASLAVFVHGGRSGTSCSFGPDVPCRSAVDLPDPELQTRFRTLFILVLVDEVSISGPAAS